MNHQRQPRPKAPASAPGAASSSGVYAKASSVTRAGTVPGRLPPHPPDPSGPPIRRPIAPYLPGRNRDALLIAAPLEAGIESSVGNAWLLDAIASALSRGASFVELRASSGASAALAFARLESVRNALVGRGVPADRVLVGATTSEQECDGPAGLPEGVRVRLLQVEES